MCSFAGIWSHFSSSSERPRWASTRWAAWTAWDGLSSEQPRCSQVVIYDGFWFFGQDDHYRAARPIVDLGKIVPPQHPCSILASPRALTSTQLDFQVLGKLQLRVVTSVLQSEQLSLGEQVAFSLKCCPARETCSHAFRMYAWDPHTDVPPGHVHRQAPPVQTLRLNLYRSSFKRLLRECRKGYSKIRPAKALNLFSEG